MTSPRLIGLAYSPWTEKARFALDHHRILYRYHEHLPMLGEPLLRLASGKLVGPVSVPLLLHDGRAIGDSFEIARYAERIGEGAPLLPSARLGELRAWDDESQAVMAAGRARVIERTLASPDALAEGLPPFIPPALRGASRGVAALGARYLGHKYGGVGGEAACARMTESLEKLERAIRKGRYLLGSPSFADVSMAAALQFVSPLADRWIPLGPATRAAWTEPALAERFADLVAWRDAFYEAHRPASTRLPGR